jgi:hypothetical protein
MGHLFHAHAEERLSPALHGVEFGGLEVFSRIGLQTEQGEEVAAQQVVLELGRFGQQVQQVLPTQRRLAHRTSRLECPVRG